MSQSSRAPSSPLTRPSAETLPWAMGLFCGFLGAFLLIAPHHFQTPPYAALLPFAIAWGTLALASGVGLLTVAVIRPSRGLRLAAHVLAGLTLLALGASFGAIHALTGCFTYAVLGLGTIAAGLLPSRPPRPETGDLFALLISLGVLLSGLLMTAFPGLFQSAMYGPYRRVLPVFGLLLLLAGGLLAWAQLRPPAEDRRWAVHAFSGTVCVLFGLLVSVPGRVWTGIVLYCVGGVAIAFLPALRRWLAGLDTASLRARLSLALAVATSLALVLSTAVVTAQEEQLAREQVTAAQAMEAQSVAQNISDFIERNGARTATLAVSAGQSATTPESQERLLAEFHRLYPDLLGLRTVTADGRILAASGRVPLPPRPVIRLAAEAMREGGVRLDVVESGGQVLLLLAAPVSGFQETSASALVAAFNSDALGRRIARQGSYVSLADGYGRLIATANGLQRGETLPPLPDGWDRTIRAGGRVERETGVVGFARVHHLEWVVAVERSQDDALAGVRRGRDLAFGLLLLVTPLAVAAGIFAARRIARPLGNLSNAVGEMTAGNLEAPLGASSGVTEVARLASSFQEMRARLAERTRESERLAAELRARAEALAESDRRKDEFLAMLAHELRNPLGAIANASYLLEQLAPPDPQLAKPIAIVRRQIQHLVRMVDDLLDVSRITRGKVELRRERIDLAEVLRHAVETARPLAENREQALEAEIPAGPLPLEGDATRLEQVFSNLLRNAVKFTDSGGTIAVSAALDGGGTAVVRVRDNGIGIPADLLPRVFELFAQGEQGLDRSGAGLGIGLTLVRSLVEMHGGQVEARSEGRGQGSEFEVRLPLA